MVNHQAQAQPTSAAGRAQQEASTVDRSVLPAADSPFRGRIEVAFKDSTADWPEPLKAPEGAPNVLLIMGDDIGYGHMSAFGGPANTPVFDRLAARGGRRRPDRQDCAGLLLHRRYLRRGRGLGHARVGHLQATVQIHRHTEEGDPRSQVTQHLCVASHHASAIGPVARTPRMKRPSASCAMLVSVA
jgi:hypothetical protein